ncbi:PREDICTED: zinc finger protein 142-like, partial [Merops nubicus]|uniref:zinc finger protein 142-like n=1 Tax=Merops nubicus TaxID=57421 RepID=UPI0004F0B14A
TCKESFATREALEEHKTRHFSHRCELRSFAAKERQQLVWHYVETHEPSAPQDKALRCPFCDFTCCHQLVFDQHVKGHGGTRIYKCLDCEYTTKNRQKITWHIRIHTGEKPYKCHLCKYACADPSRLKSARQANSPPRPVPLEMPELSVSPSLAPQSTLRVPRAGDAASS